MSVKEIATLMTLKSIPSLLEHFRNEEAQSELCRLMTETNDAY